MADFVQILVTVLSVGSLYALIALGYTMVYGTLRFINFAHSDVVVLGAWLGYSQATRLLPAIGQDAHNPQGPVPWWIAALVLCGSMLGCAVVGFVLERLAYRPLRKAPRLNVLITAIGVSLLLQNLGQLPFVFGSSPQKMPLLIPNVELLTLSFGSGPEARKVGIGSIDVTIFVTAALLMIALEFLIYRTRFGSAMRAVSFNTETASLIGIPVDRVISITFVLASALAAAAGFLYSMKYQGLNQPAHSIWVLLGLKAFVAAVIGGIGQVRGAVLGGFTIAAVEQFGAYYLSSNYRDVYVFALLILILLFKPTGLLGTVTREKV